MIAFLARFVGPTFAKPLFFGLLASLLIGGGFTVARCTRDHIAERQAEQTTRSGDAIANAAQNAVETITNQTATEAVIDRATANAQKEIDDAENPDDLRAAVLRGVCGQASHRNDPACAVR